jgi:hypothetical protein
MTTLSLAAAAVGEQDTAIELAHPACDERDPLMLIMARNFPHYRHVCEDPRLGDVIRRLGLPT